MAKGSAEDAGQWLAAARAGSREALGQVLEACRRYLLQVANRELEPDLRAKGGASDLVQQTFLEAQQAFGQFHGDNEAELLAWLRRLLLNNLANFSRDFRETDKRRLDREVALAGGDSSTGHGGGPAAVTPSPSQQAAAREEAELLRQAIERLPEEDRRIIALRHQEQRSFEEIAQQMQCSPSGARNLWLHAVERLQKELETRHERG